MCPAPWSRISSVVSSDDCIRVILQSPSLAILWLNDVPAVVRRPSGVHVVVPTGNLDELLDRKGREGSREHATEGHGSSRDVITVGDVLDVAIPREVHVLLDLMEPASKLRDAGLLKEDVLAVEQSPL